MHLRRLFLGSLSFSPRQLTRHRATNLGLVAAASFSFALISAQAFACDLWEPQKGTVAEVKFGETLALTDGTAVRLVNAKALAAPLSWRVVNEAKEALSATCLRRRGRAGYRYQSVDRQETESAG
jgi:hypothetical protein